ncbi:hypothetical protein SAMN05216466_106226 [Paraburkholderia phenazinium]|uniref:Uncharacterized protein n=1 Tax=Paraburkholderia phenazinium TaxID=60549 RepID=A0A1G7YKR7_9BURK|nr:hypothetical protein [Paraburkholderia phenazinium]SDG96967.1 hypothetical protein SAMN05216466_106226 [Paraburkholderia phenazinium]
MITIEMLDDEVLVRRLNAVASLHDEQSIGEDLAALFLGRSRSTLERMRSEGRGPEYIQAVQEGGPKHAGRRPGVTYLMKDLRAWRDAHKVSNPREAAHRDRKALKFETLVDLLDEQPWFVKRGADELVGHVLTGSEEMLEARLNDRALEVVWLPMPEAMTRPWRNLRERTPFHEAYIEVMGEAMRLSQVRQDDAEIRAQFDVLEEERGEPLPPGPGHKPF